MAKYTIEDIEILRQKSGISYEEAVNLLEYHNGSLARALVDLEKNGRLRNDETASRSHKGLKGLFEFLFRLRVKVKKGNTTIINLDVSTYFVPAFQNTEDPFIAQMIYAGNGNSVDGLHADILSFIPPPLSNSTGDQIRQEKSPPSTS